MREELLEIRHFLVFHYPEELKLAVPGPLESLGMERREERVRWGRLDVQLMVARKPKRKSWLNGRSGPEQLAKRTKLFILLYVLAMVNRSVQSKARLRNLCNGEK